MVPRNRILTGLFLFATLFPTSVIGESADDLKARLNELLLRYTDAHPNVVELRDQIKRLKSQRASQPRRQAQSASQPLALDGEGHPRVVLQRNRAGHYVGKGKINGKPVLFLVDTGATEVALPLALARRLDLRLRPGGMSKTANGNVRVWRTRLDSVDLGGMRLNKVRATVLPNMPGEEVLLGMSYLKHYELLQRGNTLTLRPQG